MYVCWCAPKHHTHFLILASYRYWKACNTMFVCWCAPNHHTQSDFRLLGKIRRLETGCMFADAPRNTTRLGLRVSCSGTEHDYCWLKHLEIPHTLFFGLSFLVNVIWLCGDCRHCDSVDPASVARPVSNLSQSRILAGGLPTSIYAEFELKVCCVFRRFLLLAILNMMFCCWCTFEYHKQHGNELSPLFMYS